MIHPEEIENSPVIVCPWCLHRVCPTMTEKYVNAKRVVCYHCEQPYTLKTSFTMKREVRDD